MAKTKKSNCSNNRRSLSVLQKACESTRGAHESQTFEGIETKEEITFLNKTCIFCQHFYKVLFVSSDLGKVLEKNKMSESQRDIILAPFAVVFTALPLAVAFYHNELLCEENPVACVAYELKYKPEQRNFDVNGALEQGLTRLETIVQMYTQ